MSTAAKVEEIRKIVNSTVRSDEDKDRVHDLLNALGSAPGICLRTVCFQR